MVTSPAYGLGPYADHVVMYTLTCIQEDQCCNT